MNNPVTDALQSLTDLLRQRAGVNVTLGRPMGEAGLHLWPWQLLDEPTLQASATLRVTDGDTPPPVFPVAVRLLLVASTASHGLDAYVRAHRCLLAHPVLALPAHAAADQVPVQLLPSPLPAAELAALFQAGGVPLALSSSFTLRCVS